MIRRRVIVHGHVQGVFFRETVRRRAESGRVSGWIGNRVDGAVEVVFQGQPAAVERLVEFCTRGPRSARVDRIDVFEEELERLSGFSING